MWVQSRSYSGYFAKNTVIALLFGDKFGCQIFQTSGDSSPVVYFFFICSSFFFFNIGVLDQKERDLQCIGNVDSFLPWPCRMFQKMSPQHPSTPEVRCSTFGWTVPFKGLRFLLTEHNKSVSDAAESTCCRARRPRAHGGLPDANAIVSLWTDGWHNRCVNMTSIQPVLCVWLA